jgi:uncharacterized membrane protein YidH (DUF202 family)
METDRVEQFKNDIQTMKLKTGSASKEGVLQTLGALLMAGGIVLAFVSYNASLNTKATLIGQLDSSSYQTLSIVGLAMTVAGTGMFLRYSIAKFLRIWMLRQSYENQANIERLVNNR